ncbi:MAG: class I SAM-dependent methyltransferase [Nostoc sp. EfeVER01]|uniref:class I SAM-dependent methyltransferase n=1 Tax=unclassified Nostoc TaxID=2593658 RepID=UPI002AD36617|nr:MULTISPECIES: methyltransferase domain-containing protein [unclassified Nostoc]MDZ7948961.1 methyltransferase domain-containing protein [Nostoc sp. EfeVER01]MDZ7992473.1 methyltransferase domain-containing protein [Nostoc sp. EspVER01]
MDKWYPEDYCKNSSDQQKWAQEAIFKLNLKGNESILDIGCGDGKVTADIASYIPNGSVIGIDNSSEMIEFAQKTFSPSDFPNLTFQLADAKNLNFNKKFDVIVSFFCLHWIIDHIPVITGIERSLKPNGRVLLQFTGKTNNSHINTVMSKVMSSASWSKYFDEFTWPWGFYEPNEYKNWLENVGLKVNRVELLSTTKGIFEGKERLNGFIRTILFPFTARIPKVLQQNFVEEIGKTYLETYPSDRMGFIYVPPVVRLEVDATKIVN